MLLSILLTHIIRNSNGLDEIVSSLNIQSTNKEFSYQLADEFLRALDVEMSRKIIPHIDSSISKESAHLLYRWATTNESITHDEYHLLCEAVADYFYDRMI